MLMVSEHDRLPMCVALQQIKTTDIMLRSLPQPSPPHVAAVDRIIEDVFREHALSDLHRKRRQQAFDLIVATITKQIPGKNKLWQMVVVWGHTSDESGT